MSRTARGLLAVVAAGVPAAFAWWALARPSQWLVTERGLILTESEAGGRFQVVVVFTIIGVVVGLVAGIVVQFATRPSRWETVVGLAAASTAASLLCWQLGIWFGPSAPREASGLQTGDLVSSPLAVDSVVPFLVWPLAAVLGYTLTLYLGSDGVEDQDDVSARSAP